MKVYRTNNNPKIIGGYFLEAVTLLGGCPKLVRGDYGTENKLVCDYQMFYDETAQTVLQVDATWMGPALATKG